MVDFTVAIRTYNRADLLSLILDRLRSQIGTEGIQWEVVVVDNNSTDHTAKTVQDYQANWTSSCPLRYVVELKQGASFARRRSIQEAQGELIGFLDDDNVPALDWVKNAYTFAQSYPKAGAYGGQIHGSFEVEPPHNFGRIAHFFPVIERREVICFTSKYPNKKVLPPGAGLVIRKTAWLENVPENLSLKGPVGNSLSAKGEDIEALLYLSRAGWEVWFNPEMHIYHQIPKHRFEKDYLIQFFRGIGFSRYYTRMLGWSFWQRPLILPLYMTNDLLKVVLHIVKYRRRLITDIVLACEMELFLSSFISPFHACKKYFLGKGIHSS